MNRKPPKSVNRLDRARPQPVGKPGAAAGPGPARPIAEELRPAGSVLPRRPPGRPRKDGKPAGSVKPQPVPGPGPSQVPPAPEPKPPYVPIPAAALALSFKSTFGFLAGVLSVALKLPAAELEITDQQAKDLADGWKPLIDHYQWQVAGVGLLWYNAIGMTAQVVGPKVQAVMARRRMTLPVPQPEEVRIVPPGIS